MNPRLTCLFLLCALAAPAPADRVTLADGTVLEGDVEIGKDRLRIQVEGRARTFAWDKVKEVALDDPVPEARVEPGSDVLALYEAKAKELQEARETSGEVPVDRAVEVAKWCAGRGMWDEAGTVLGPVLSADAFHAPSLAIFRKVTGRFVSRVAYRLPLEGAWLASVDETGHHAKKVFAVYAIDFLLPGSDGKLFTGRGDRLEDFHGWGEPVLAPADGVVYYAVDRFPDLPVGRAGKFEEANGIAIQHDNGEASLLGHIQHGSAQVKEGDRVTAGQVVARIGNSGASGLPHLHFVVSHDVAGCFAAVPWRLGSYRRRFGRAEVVFRNAPVPEGATVSALDEDGE